MASRFGVVRMFRTGAGVGIRVLRAMYGSKGEVLVAGSVAGDRLAEPADRVKFTDPEVQDILSRITGLDLNKVFQPIKQELSPPKYKLLTDAQLQEAIHRVEEHAKQLLESPPVLDERKPIQDILSEDKMLEGSDTAKYVFTDINFSTPHRERFILVREPSGILRKASWEERDRFIQVYFPKEGRKHTAPPIFKEENLKSAFGQNRHEEVLKHCLVQFEPDSADFKRVHVMAYEDIENNGKYDLLRSTRFFGGLVWYLVCSRRADGLLLEMLQREWFEEAVCLVRLFNLLHPHSDSALRAQRQNTSGVELLKIFADSESQRAGFIKLALKSYNKRMALSSA
ncbi:small ribosomal subunit protein mS22-like isoform X2 [Hoplias malabaricus]|uniref:small ribosomal subunit protein mS22-like isoform X2 n=1 Tax=Hoplias malabaricus TaxID=27720 RepID=UPI0034617E7B